MTLVQHDDANTDQHPRAPRMELEVAVRFHHETNFYVGFSENIAEGGIFVATHELKPIGTAMDISFTLPDGTELEVKGIVRWIRHPRDVDSDTPPGLGIQFEKLSIEAHSVITEFGRVSAPLFYPD